MAVPKDGQALARKLSAMSSDPSRAAVYSKMEFLINQSDGGEGTVELRNKRAQDGSFLSPVNAYWAYTLFTLRGRPIPYVVSIWRVEKGTVPFLGVLVSRGPF